MGWEENSWFKTEALTCAMRCPFVSPAHLSFLSHAIDHDLVLQRDSISSPGRNGVASDERVSVISDDAGSG